MATNWKDGRRFFRTLIANIALELQEKDRENLAFQYEIKGVTALGIFEQLEKRGDIGQAKIAELKEILTNIKRTDLITNLVEPFEKNQLQESIPAQPTHRLPVQEGESNIQGQANMFPGLSTSMEEIDNEETRPSAQKSFLGHKLPESMPQTPNSMNDFRPKQRHYSEPCRPVGTSTSSKQLWQSHSQSPSLLTNVSSHSTEPFPAFNRSSLTGSLRGIPSCQSEKQQKLDLLHRVLDILQNEGISPSSSSHQLASLPAQMSAQITTEPTHKVVVYHEKLRDHHDTESSTGIRSTPRGSLDSEDTLTGSLSSPEILFQPKDSTDLQSRAGEQANVVKLEESGACATASPNPSRKAPSKSKIAHLLPWHRKKPRSKVVSHDSNSVRWSVRRDYLWKAIFRHQADHTIECKKKLEVDVGNGSSLNPKLTLILHPYGLDEDYRTNVTMAVHVDAPKKAPKLKKSTKVMLTLKINESKGRHLGEFTLCENLDLRVFYQDGFLSHDVLKRSQSETIEIVASAHKV